MAAKWKQFTEEEFAKIIADSLSYREAITKLGYNPDGGSILQTIKKVCEERNIDTSHFLGQ